MLNVKSCIKEEELVAYLSWLVAKLVAKLTWSDAFESRVNCQWG